MIYFNVPPYVCGEENYVNEAIKSHNICGDNSFTFKCQEILNKKLAGGGSSKSFLTTSGTTALEMACMLANLEIGDEVILPSYTFSSTATAVTLFGAKPIFVDIHPETMNIDENKIEQAISNKTKAIIVMHYAGIACEMDQIVKIAKKHNLLIIEDAAQGVNALYKGMYLGTIGDFGCFSFHETKNYSMGEGGAIFVNNPDFLERAAIVREKGTNRTQFKNGQVDKYTWVDKGSSYLPSDILAAYLYPQLLIMDEMRQDRIDSYNEYYRLLQPLQNEGLIDLPYIPNYCFQNGHMFYIKVWDIEERKKLQNYLREKQIISAFHYIPLHTSPEGMRVGKFVGDDKYTTKESERLLRLPLYYQMNKDDIHYVCECINSFYDEHKKCL